MFHCNFRSHQHLLNAAAEAFRECTRCHCRRYADFRLATTQCGRDGGALFENAAKEEEEDEFDFGTPQMISENEELKQYKKAYDELKKINYTMRNALNHIYANTHYVKGNFGKGYYKLNMSQEKFNELNKLIHVHHH